MTVSVVVPARDAGRHLRPAVESALACGDVEVLVVDDGTTDGSLETLSGLDARVLRSPGRGEAAARNAGVRAASAPFVTFLDADDLLEPPGLPPRLRALKEDPAALAVGGLPSRLIGEEGETLAEVAPRMARAWEAPFRLSLADYRADRFFPVSCSLWLYRREAFARVGPYDETLPAAPDADFHFRLLSLGPVTVLDVPAFARRLHGANMSLAGGAQAFKPDVLAAIETVNRRHGVVPKEVRPWEAEYL